MSFRGFVEGIPNPFCFFFFFWHMQCAMRHQTSKIMLVGVAKMEKDATADQADENASIVQEEVEKNDDENVITIWKTIAYCSPAFSLSMVSILVSTFVPKLYSDTYGVSLSAIGAISIAALVFDAISDPLVGFASDETRSRFGRRRPWILFGSIGMSVVAVCLLSPPTSLGTGALVAWASVFIIGMISMTTVVRIPFLSLGTELLTGAFGKKTSVFGIREVVFVAGTLVAAGLPLIIPIEDEISQFRVIGIIVAILASSASFLCVWFIKEPRMEDLPERKYSFCQGWLQLLSRYWDLLLTLCSDSSARSLLVSATIFNAATFLNAFFFPYWVDYVVDAQDKLEVVLILYILLGVVFIPVWVWLSKRFEKHLLIKCSMLLQSSVLFLGFILIGLNEDGENSFEIYAGLVALAGVSLGAFSLLKFSMISDLTDVLEWQNNARREAELQGLFDFFQKFCSGIIVGTALIVLDNVGYVPNQRQTSESRMAIASFYALVPAILGFIATIVVYPYNISRLKYETLKQEFQQQEKQQQEKA